MIIKYFEGELLNSNCDIICHQVNCQCTMGAGISKVIRRRWPIVFEQYSRFLNNNYRWENGKRCNTGEFLGLCQIVKVGDHRYVGNLFGQNFYSIKQEDRFTDYDALLCALMNLKRLILFGGYDIKTLAFPYNIGSDAYSKGDVAVVHRLIEAVFNDLDVEIHYYKFRINQPKEESAKE